jgi:hypothetical protein
MELHLQSHLRNRWRCCSFCSAGDDLRTHYVDQNDSNRRNSSFASRRPANLALQRRMGLLPQRRPRPRVADSRDCGVARQTVTVPLAIPHGTGKQDPNSHPCLRVAILFALLLSGPVEALNRKGLPRSASAVLILFLFLGILGGAVELLWSPAQAWLTAAPRTAQIIQLPMSGDYRRTADPAAHGGATARVESDHRLPGVMVRRVVLGDSGHRSRDTRPCRPQVAAEHSREGGALVEFLSPSKAKRVKQRRPAVRQQKCAA